MVALGGKLAVASCQGPRITFTPGRADAPGPNKPGMLPGADDAADAVAAAADRMGFELSEFVVVVGMGHTVCNLVSASARADCHC